jgi:rhamnogalacturonan endolyase
MKFIRSLFLLLPAGFIATAQPPVTLRDNGTTVTLANGIVSFSFNKTNADLTGISNKRSSNLLGKKGRGYLLGPGFSMSPSQFKIVRQDNDLVELSFYHDASNHFQYDLHYVLRRGDAGAYCFLIQSHRAADSAGIYGQTRWGISADENLFDYHLVRDSIQGPMPKMSALDDNEKVQDWTFKLNDSTYYTKYDYADYIEGRHVHGMAGQRSGLGLFVIQASHEYLNGGPTKQYQNVHATPYLICMFNCGHFLSDIRKADDRITGDWSKLDGPFMLYVNEGRNTDAVWADAKKKAEEETDQWPYEWMDNPRYPLKRGIVAGQLLVNNQPAPEGTHVILAAPGYDWQAQTQGYIYAVQTTPDGRFNINNVRKGNYTLYAYGANQTEEFKKADISVGADIVTLLGKIYWQPAKNGALLWQLGAADRTTKGFRLSDHKRNYGLFNLPPATLDYTIGKSNEQTDWYYAQTKNGSWNIHFSTNKSYTGEATLTIAIAGAAKNPPLEILVNNQPAGSFTHLGNDASVYRSAVAGGYYQKLELKFPASLLQQGDNTLSLKIPAIKPGGGIMYDAIKLEAK